MTVKRDPSHGHYIACCLKDRGHAVLKDVMRGATISLSSGGRRASGAVSQLPTMVLGGVMAKVMRNLGEISLFNRCRRFLLTTSSWRASVSSWTLIVFRMCRRDGLVPKSTVREWT